LRHHSKGDKYTYELEIALHDEDGDGVLDMTAAHVTERNGALFVSGSVTWYGLPQEVIESFIGLTVDAGLESGTKEFHKFQHVVQEWRKFTQFFKQLNDLGEATAELVEAQ
jgi:hypothetical protein